MITIKSKFTEKEKLEIEILISELKDLYGDFYITRNNIRLYIKENIHLLFDSLNKGDFLVYEKNKGVLLVTGFSDNAKRIYVKILAKDLDSTEKLIKNAIWHCECPLYIKIKKNNPIIPILKNNNFKFLGDRGKEILLKRDYIASKSKDNQKGDKDVK